MRIRRGKLKDAKELLKLLRQTPELQTSEEAIFYTLNWVKDVISSKKTDLALICEENKNIIGFLLAELHTKKGYSFLEDIFVKPRYRKKGIATKLFNEFEKICKKLKLKKAGALVLTTNKKMLAWCKKHNLKKGNKFYWVEKRL